MLCQKYIRYFAKENKRLRYQYKFFRAENLNFIVDEYDGEVLNETKTPKSMC